MDVAEELNMPDYELTMPAIVRRAAALFPDQEFIVMPDRQITFGELERSSRILAKQLLVAGVGKGTRVGIHLPTGPEWAIAFAAVTRVGAVAMPFSTLYRPIELQTALRVGDVAVLVSTPEILGKDHEDFLEEAVPGLREASAGRLRLSAVPYLRSIILIGETTRHWSESMQPAVSEFDDELFEAIEAQVTAGDWLLVLFTSGTTAAPKAIVHSHGAALLKTSPAAGSALHAMHPGRVLNLMPFFWIGGMQELLSSMQSGATLLTLERLEADVALELGRRERATSVMGNSKAMQSLFGATNIDELIPTVLPQPQRSWDGPPSSRSDPATALGMSETFGPWAVVPGFEARVVDPESGNVQAEGVEGEFQVRGYALMQAMYKREREEVFEADGFYRTGDIGYLENGLVYFKGRLNEMIKTKGANVAPAEVEAVLNAQPGVRISFVFGFKNDDVGEEVVAAVMSEGDERVDVDLLHKECRRSLSSYKVPRSITVLSPDEVPYLSSSKPDRRGIKEMLRTQRESAAS
jgi:acyl-CoA synthetase (AMP-forming)/AMP-acid ligase II